METDKVKPELDDSVNLIGLGPVLGLSAERMPLWMHSMSLMNIMLVLGAFCAALLSRQF